MRFLLHRRLIPSATTRTGATVVSSVSISPQLLVWKDVTRQRQQHPGQAASTQDNTTIAPSATSCEQSGDDYKYNLRITSNISKDCLVARTDSTAGMIRQGASSVNASASAVAASSSIRAWGQQCSEHCGCAIRFEMTMDPLTQVITSARYIAKQVVGSKRQQPSAPPSHRPQQQQKTAFTRTTMLPLPIPQWNPQYTFGGSRQKQQHGQQHGQQLQPPKRRPLITTCSCSTLQQLANQVTQHLPHHTLDQIRNELEFTMPRSSLAVSHTILRQQQLPVNHTHCWDVLEEALTAMIKGYLPRPRRMVHVRVPRQQPDDLPGPLDDDDDDNISPWEESSQRISSPTSTESPSQDTHHHTTSLLDVNYYNDKNPHNDQGWEHRNSYSYHPFHGHHESSSSSSSSPLDMMNMMYSMSPSLQHQVDNIRRPHRRSNYSSSFYDWVSYVDELRHQEEEEEEEQSA